ncbi:hypothetical protein, partial [Ralstonia pseudosolanacearum]
QQIMDSTATQLGTSALFQNYVTDGDGMSTAAEVNLPVFAFSDLPRAQQNAEKQADYMGRVVDEFHKRIV